MTPREIADGLTEAERVLLAGLWVIPGFFRRDDFHEALALEGKGLLDWKVFDLKDGILIGNTTVLGGEVAAELGAG